MAKNLLNLSQAAQAAGITRRTLYNHVKQGKVTVSRDGKNNPVVDVSELIRVYGNVKLPEKEIPTVSHRKNAHKIFPLDQLQAMQKELAELKQAVTLMLDEVRRLTGELEQEKKKGFWARVFR